MKSVAILASQVALVVGMAVGVFAIIAPEIYVVVGAIVLLVTAGLMVSANDDPEHSIGWILSLCVLSATFGVFWPSLPIIAAWGGAMNRSRARASTSTDDVVPPSTPPGQ